MTNDAEIASTSSPDYGSGYYTPTLNIESRYCSHLVVKSVRVIATGLLSLEIRYYYVHVIHFHLHQVNHFLPFDSTGSKEGSMNRTRS